MGSARRKWDAGSSADAHSRVPPGTAATSATYDGRTAPIPPVTASSTRFQPLRAFPNPILPYDLRQILRQAIA